MSILKDLGVRNHEGRSSEELVYNIAFCYTLMENAMERVLKPFRLSPVKMNALLIVKHAGGDKGISQSELSKRMVVTAGNITRLTDRLQKEALLERVALEGDRRVNLLRITRKGSNLLDRAWPHYLQAIEKMVGSKGPGFAETLKYLEHLRKNLPLFNQGGK